MNHMFLVYNRQKKGRNIITVLFSCLNLSRQIINTHSKDVPVGINKSLLLQLSIPYDP
jgi:hypothetical protein